MNTTPEALVQRCAGLFSGCGQAIEWVREVRKNAQRLDRDADGLTTKLRRTRNLCRRLGSAAARPVSAGVFGMSQAGKSYLISTLARGENDQLQTVLDGERIDFIGHVNPPGGGKEATGLVTRFTRQPSRAPAGYPIELTLFSEADVVKILGNSFFNDFDRERASFDTDAERIRQLLATLEKQRQPQPTGGLDEDDMVDILEYFEKRFAKSMEPLKADYWPAAVELAPRLPAAQRAKLLSVLWGGEANAAFGEVYLKLRDALQRLSNAPVAYVPLAALVTGPAGKREWRQDSILNVDVLDKLGRDEAEPLLVLPASAEEVHPEVGIARSLLAVLTAEMKFVLADKPVADLLEQVDLLDFPGYRGRLSIASLDEVRKEVKREDADPVAQLLLRGKVAFLFERYTDDQEMNVLIMCTRCDTQIEITTLAPVLTAWVHNTQGETAPDRGGRLPGLVWVITQLDRRLEPKPGQTSTQQRQEWSNMMHITLLERFGQCEWLDEWSPGKPFDNVFLVRKPGFLRSVIDTAGENDERGLLPGQRERLAEMRSFFIENEGVSAHVRDPGAAWDAVLKLNDGGMQRLAAFLGEVATRGRKLERIREQVTRVTEEIVEHRLSPYFQAEGAGEVEKKQQLAAAVSSAIEERPDSFGEMLLALQPSSEQMRRLYLRADTPATADPAAEGGPAPPRPSRPSLVRLPLPGKAAAGEARPAAVTGRAVVFAKAVISEWFKQLRDLADDTDMQRYLGLSAQTVQGITDELITASDRRRLEERLVQKLQPLEDKRSTTRIGIVDQQVLLARCLIADFIDYLDFAAVPLADRPPSRIDGRRIFEPPSPIAIGELPRLPAEELPYSGMYIVDWLEAFRLLAVGNAGHSAGREITPEQNLRLGAILSVIRGSAAAVAASGGGR